MNANFTVAITSMALEISFFAVPFCSCVVYICYKSMDSFVINLVFAYGFNFGGEFGIERSPISQ